MTRVLIVDDAEPFVKSLVRQLGDELHAEDRVVGAASYGEALSTVRAAARPFDIFLIDERLGPGLNGVDLFQQLRALSPTTGGIIFTRVGDKAAGDRALRAGAYQYLPKPFDVGHLLRSVQTFLLSRWLEQLESLPSGYSGLLQYRR